MDNIQYFGSNSFVQVAQAVKKLCLAAKKSILICDPYLSADILLDFLEVSASEIMLMVGRNNPSLVKRAQEFHRQFPNINVSCRRSNEFHDRWIVIDGSEVWLIGQSLGDAGKSPTVLIKIMDQKIASALTVDIKNLWERATGLTSEITNGARSDKKVPVEISYARSREEMISSSIAYFQARMCDAFPGTRGLASFDDLEIMVQRLSVLFNDKLPDFRSDSIWYLRETASMPVEDFMDLSKGKIHFSCEEVVPKKLSVYRSSDFWKEFVLLECAPDQSTGLYQEKGAYEEFAIKDGKMFTREEYDDGSAIIDGRPKSIFGARLRCRYLEPTIWLFTAKGSPLIQTDFDQYFKAGLSNIFKAQQHSRC